MVVTVLEGRVAATETEVLIDEFQASDGHLPPGIRESFLLTSADGERWQVLSVWRDQEALDAYRASVETPGGVLMFRAAGVEPSLEIHEVAAHLSAD